MNIAVILAGGVGSRFGANVPKQFVEVLGKPVIAYTIEQFENHNEIDKILVVCVKPYIKYIWDLKEKYNFSKIEWVTEGGQTFQESVINGVRFLNDKVNADDVVLFHFAASPFIKEDIISDSIRVCNKTNTNAISTIDYYLLSGKKNSLESVNVDGNFTDEYIDRDSIAVMSTPHAFKYKFISDIYEEAEAKDLLNKVEPHTTTLMYAMNKKIYFSKGSQSNIKITRKDDIELFEGYVLEQMRKTSNVKTAHVVVFMADGVEESEAIILVDILRRAKLNVLMASVMNRIDVKSSRGIIITTDCLGENVDFSDVKMIVLPGGRTGVNNLKQSSIVKEQCLNFSKNKYIGAICAAPTILDELGLLRGKRITVHPDFENCISDAIITNEQVTIDNNIITGKAMAATIPFALNLVETLKGEELSKKISEEICY